MATDSRTYLLEFWAQWSALAMVSLLFCSCSLLWLAVGEMTFPTLCVHKFLYFFQGFQTLETGLRRWMPSDARVLGIDIPCYFRTAMRRRQMWTSLKWSLSFDFAAMQFSRDILVTSIREITNKVDELQQISASEDNPSWILAVHESAWIYLFYLIYCRFIAISIPIFTSQETGPNNADVSAAILNFVRGSTVKMQLSWQMWSTMTP